MLKYFLQTRMKQVMCLWNTMSPFARFWPIYLTFDLEGWPWPFTTQNVQLHEIHMHAKYQVAIFNIAKVMANVKVCANKPTNKPTNKQTGQKQYVPQYRLGDIINSISFLVNLKMFGFIINKHIYFYLNSV